MSKEVSEIVSNHHMIAVAKLNELRGYKSAEKFADDIGVSVNTWHSWNKHDNKTTKSVEKRKNSGFRNIGMEHALKISKKLDISLDWLFGLCDDKHSHKATSTNWEHEASYIFRILRWILEGELPDCSIEDFVDIADKSETVIVLKNEFFEKFIENYRDAIDSEDFTDDGMASEAKEAIFTEFVKKYVDLIKERS